MSAQAYPRRADFGDPQGYARAMAACGPRSADDVDLFVGLAGPYGEVQRAVWGTRAEREAELVVEMRAAQVQRPYVFIVKLRQRRGSAALGVLRPGSTLLGEAEVGEVLAAAEFARARAWLLDFSVTVCPSLVGVFGSTGVEAFLRRYLKNLAQFLRDNGLPCAFVGVVENGAIGLHLHLALHAPLNARARVKAWHEQFLRREAKRRGVAFDPDVVQFSRHRRHHPLLADLLVSYAVKSFDPRVVVQSAAVSLDGCEVRLSDLIACEFHDPGVVAFERVIIGPALAKPARGAWRSAWERGARRVDQLYASEFVRFVQGRSRAVVLPGLTEALALRACADALLDAIGVGDGIADPMHAVEACGANVELIARAVERLAFDIVAFEAAELGRPQRVALETLRLSMKAATQLVDTAGARAVAVVLEDALPRALVRAVVPALERVDERVRAVAAQLGEAAVAPRWVLQLTCARLQRV